MPLFAGESIAKGIFGTILYVIKSEGHFGQRPVPGEVQPLLRRRARDPAGPRPEAVTQLTVPELDRRFAGLTPV